MSEKIEDINNGANKQEEKSFMQKSMKEKIVTIFTTVGVLWFMYSLCFSATSPTIIRPVFVAFVLLLGLILGPRPGKNKIAKTVILVIDIVFVALVVASTIYIIMDHFLQCHNSYCYSRIDKKNCRMASCHSYFGIFCICYTWRALPRKIQNLPV